MISAHYVEILAPVSATKIFETIPPLCRCLARVKSAVKKIILGLIVILVLEFPPYHEGEDEVEVDAKWIFQTSPKKMDKSGSIIHYTHGLRRLAA
ncbi:MAG TPA: hypothetical protein VGO57_09855 [Verrucomicrobiae bacterium]